MTDEIHIEAKTAELREWADSPHVQAAVEQAQAQFMDDMYVLMTMTHASCLAKLRGNLYVQALLSRQLAMFIGDLDEQQTRILLMQLAGGVAINEAELHHEGDMEASIAAIGGPEDFMRIEAYIASNGDLCLFCGVSTLLNNDGTTHTCAADDDDTVA